jgi:chemotaxis protein CheX
MDVDKNDRPYILPAVLDSTAAPRIAQELLHLRGNSLTLDGRQVERVSSQCLQVLLSAALTWNRDNHDFKIEMASDQLVSSIQTLGIETPSLLQVA